MIEIQIFACTWYIAVVAISFSDPFEAKCGKKVNILTGGCVRKVFIPASRSSSAGGVDLRTRRAAPDNLMNEASNGKVVDILVAIILMLHPRSLIIKKQVFHGYLGI